jgi:hypothetical protein
MITSFTDRVVGVIKMGGWCLHLPPSDGLRPSFTDISLPGDEVTYGSAILAKVADGNENRYDCYHAGGCDCRGCIQRIAGEFGCTDAINRRLHNQNSFWGINFGDVLHCGGSYRRDKAASVRAVQLGLSTLR